MDNTQETQDQTVSPGEPKRRARETVAIDKIYEGTGPLPLLSGRGEVALTESDGKIVAKRFERDFGAPLAVIGEPSAKDRVSIGLNTNKGQKLTFPLGLILIFAPTGVGKSTFTRILQKRAPERILPLKVVEPFDDLSEIMKIPAFASADDALVYGLTAWARNKKVIPVLDSLRAPLFEIAGSAGDKGIIMAFFTALTRVSNALAVQGCTMFATLNPMSDKIDQQELINTMLKASLPGLINLKSFQDNLFQGEVILRDVVNYREPIPFTLLDAPPVRSASSSSVPGPIQITPEDKLSISDTVLINLNSKM